MGILSGGIRFRRYQVLGEPPEGFRTAYEESIQRNAFRDFSSNDEREQVVGWVCVDDWFSTDLNLDQWLVGNTLNLTLRIDTKRIPSRFFKQECRKLESEWRMKTGREDLTRAEREEVQSIVRRRLLDRVLPSCQGLDTSWDLDRSDLLFWSTAEKANQAFRTLFTRTFRLELQPLFPYLLAHRTVGGESTDLLERVVPSSFRLEGRS